MAKKSKEWQVCIECDRERQRCRAVSTEEDGTVLYVCRECWRNLDYDTYLYEHRTPKGYGHGV